MSIPAPHFVLYSHSRPEAEEAPSRWRFVLTPLAGGNRLEAEDEEPEMPGERVALLAVIRGLEALDQPSRVTLVTESRYVVRGLRFGLPQWRRANWCWEHFGEMVPIKNRDLWQRLERSLQFHQVDCRLQTFSETGERAGATGSASAAPSNSPAKRRFRIDSAHSAWDRHPPCQEKGNSPQRAESMAKAAS
jgi:ribonuclease HI